MRGTDVSENDIGLYILNFYTPKLFERIMFFHFVHRLMFLKKHNILEAGSVSVFR
jgi:hypothetical protein